MDLVEHGYSGGGKDRVLLAFFPFYPWLVRAFAWALRDPLLAAFVVSAAASIAAGLMLRRLAELDESRAVARSAVWFFAIFPTAYFLHIPYTESLFLGLALGCIVAARDDRWMLAGLLGACASLTRINGLILVPVLALEAFLVWRTKRRFDPRWLWSLAVGAGFLGYLWLNQHVAGDPLAFAHIQQEHWYHKLTPPWVGIRDVWLRIGRLNGMEGLHEFIYIAFTFACTIWCWVKLRASYAVWMTCNWLLITCTTFIISVPRYALTFFPIFILLGRAGTGRPLAFGAMTIAFLLFMGLYVQRFVHGLWAF
jgi:Gpi18-like mannosyltransferase